VAPIEQGVVTDEFIIIPETEIFGERIYQRRKRQKRKSEAEQIVQHLAELNVGDPVVHIEHGVGRYQGLQTITVDQKTDEYLVIEYANNDKLYVPVSSLNLISRYSSVDVEHAPLHHLGGSTWEKQKEKAQNRIRDVAAELLDIYARRAAREGFQFKKRDEQYLAFAESFPFEETPDQETAILGVIADMESAKPMDRLVCGDVGFGKTEVAMRAAFMAVHSGKQVAVLVPTTLLAHQHVENFKNRFADWPITVESLSRFETKKEQDVVLEKLAKGQIDIVIGTHRLIQSDVSFKNLGLIIIDEEHRFGVHQKEKLKSLRSEVDILTLTATPIPRTLNMAFSGIRDLSIIATPPERRLSVKTFVHENNEELTREAIQRELMRGGQVYVLHNKVEDIERFTENIQKLIPDARVGFAHGQMHERELERVMGDFYHRRFNVLVCTTIIETGIDIPTANTMIIDRADKFGLAQLHQLRGRVGRSHHQAYCYLMIPSKKALTKDAEKRLDAIRMHEDLGSGFTLATHDMEIRGAGEFLGEEQSGQMQAIGFDLYMEMLEKAVNALKAGKKIDFETPLHHPIEIDLGMPAIIPENYLPDVHARLILYKRISSAKDSEALEDLRVEMIDRFGLLPEQTKNLFEIAELKLKAAKLGIVKIKGANEGCIIEFNEKPNVDPSKIINLIQTQSKKYQLAGKNKLKIKFDERQKTSIIYRMGEFFDILF
jgi:transcription-repair coupling factor (superfamily II helicase)